MEAHIWSSWKVICIGILSFWFLAKIFRRRKLNLPPGPRPWPVIGNLLQMGALPHQSISELSKKYGPIIQLQFGSCPVVIGSSVEMAQIFLKTMDINFVSRPKTAAGKYTTYNYSNMSWSPYGAYWRQARKICVVELFSAKRLDSYEYIRAEEMKSLLKEVFNTAGKPFPLKDYVSTMSLNVISRMVLGKRYLDKSNENAIVGPEEFRKMLDELFLLNGVMNIGDFIPWLSFLDLQGYVKRMKTVGKKFDRFLEYVLDEHQERRKKTKGYTSRDMVDVLLEQAENPNLEVKLERHGVKAFTLDLLAGGAESSSVILEWAIVELLKKPELFKKVTEELDRVIRKNRLAKEADMPDLPYVDAVIKETMRLHPVAPMLTRRLAREDCKVAGYDIKKGTQVLVNVWAIQRDPSIWDNPTEFRPERFIEKPIDIKGTDFELLPFGAGRRMCPGYNLGLKNLQIALSNLLHGFNWKLPDNMKPEDLNVREVFGMTAPRETPLQAVVEPRLPLEIYSEL